MKSPGKATEIVSFKAKPADKIGAGSGFIPPAASGPVASEQPYAPPTIEAEPDVQQAIVVEALLEAEESPITGLLDQAIQTLKDGQVNQGVDQLERLIAQRNALSSKALLRGVQTLLQLGLQRRAGLLLGYAEQTGNGDPSWPLALEKARKWVEQKTQ